MKNLNQLKQKRLWLSAALGTLAFGLAACDSGGPRDNGSVATVEVALPVSLNEVKVGLINKVSDPMWTGTWNAPQNERDWRELEHLAFQIEVGGTLLKYPGTGPRDREWTSSSDWQALASQLSQDGARAVNAVRSRNRDLMDRAGGQLIETCEACHRAFNPSMPTLDRIGELPQRPPVSL